MATFAKQTDLIVDIIQDRANLAEQQLKITKDIIESIRAAILAQINAVAGNRIAIDLAGVDTDFVPSTATPPLTSDIVADIPELATPPEMPAAGEIAITDEAYNQAYLRAQGLQDRISARREWEAANSAAAMGHSQLSETQAVVLRIAQDEDDQRSSDNALASATEQQKALREDVLNVAKLLIDNYAHVTTAQTANYHEDWQNKQNKWKLLLDNYATQVRGHLQAEEIRLKYAQLQIQTIIDPERLRADYDLKLTELAGQSAVGELVDLAQLYGQIVTGLLSTSDVNLGSSNQLQIDATVYNPGAGQVVWFG